MPETDCTHDEENADYIVIECMYKHFILYAA